MLLLALFGGKTLACRHGAHEIKAHQTAKDAQ